MTTAKKELRRDKDNGKIAGVCSGVAEYFGIEVWLIRIVMVSGVILSGPLFIVAYIAAWFILDPKSKDAKTGKQENQSVAAGQDVIDKPVEIKEKIWQAGDTPKRALHDLERKFMYLESRMRKLEGYVTSTEFTVSREINRL